MYNCIQSILLMTSKNFSLQYRSEISVQHDNAFSLLLITAVNLLSRLLFWKTKVSHFQNAATKTDGHKFA